MGLFDVFKKKTAPSVDNRPWVDKYSMSGYDVGEIKGYTDLPDEPRCDEEGTQGALKWSRYGDIIIITGLTNKEIKTVNIPQTINGYIVAGIKRMAFMDCEIQFIIIPETVEYIGGMAVGFISKSVFSDDQERAIWKQKPFAENRPTSTLMDNKVYFLRRKPETTIASKTNTVAEKYAISHRLTFAEN